MIHRLLPIVVLAATGVVHAGSESLSTPSAALAAGSPWLMQEAAKAPAGGTSATRPSKPWVEDLYFLADVGVAIPQDANIRNIDPTASSFGLSGTRLKLDAGVRFDLGLGYEFTDWFAVEVASGLVWNGVSGVDGTIVDTTGAGTPIQGGSGNVYGVPIMFNGQFRFPLDKNSDRPFQLVIGGGIGAIWTDASVSGVAAPLVPGVFASVDGSAWAFAYQADVGLEWTLADNLHLGIRYAFLGTTELNLGPASFNTPLLVGTADVKADGYYTHSIMATLRIDF
jgi:opacity protein-like surface antigen